MKLWHRLVDSPLRRALLLSSLALLAPACGGGSKTPPIIIPPFSITNGSLPDAPIGAAYNQTLTTVSGTAPITFSGPLSGALPPGLAMSAAGAITGTPTGPNNGPYS